MNIKKIINEVINEYYETDKRRELERFLIDSIDFSEDFDYEIPDNIKLRKIYDVFLNEYGHKSIKRLGVEKAMLNWLQGPPSYLNIPLYYDEIKNLMYSLGYDEVQNMNKMEYTNLYFNEIIDIILKNQKELQTV